MGLRERNRANRRKAWLALSEETPQAKLAAAAQVLRLEDKPLEWVRRPVIGCAWDAKGGEFSIVAYRSEVGPGLHLHRFGNLEGCHPTLQAAKDAAEKLRYQVTVIVRTKEFFRR